MTQGETLHLTVRPRRAQRRTVYYDGGRLAFGPDGMLYATTGDGNAPNAQDPDHLNGKILRMRPNGSPPPDNPFPGSVVYSYRHPSRLFEARGSGASLSTSKATPDLLGHSCTAPMGASVRSSPLLMAHCG
jgi:glucose/arabinose dehydrogenase